MQQPPSCRANIFTASQEIPSSYGTPKLITVFTKACTFNQVTSVGGGGSSASLICYRPTSQYSQCPRLFCIKWLNDEGIKKADVPQFESPTHHFPEGADENDENHTLYSIQVKQWCPDAMLQLLCPPYNYLALMVCRSDSDVLVLCYNYCAHLPGPHGPQVKQWCPDAMLQLPWFQVWVFAVL
jgi:hypothetical protein